jgi:hypothetical protein
MTYVLPPKRFESLADTIFDPIRGRPWFQKLVKRREQIPLLEQAYKAHRDMHRSMTQYDAATQFNVDERELRDFIKYVDGVSVFSSLTKAEQLVYQRILDNAYDLYDRFRAQENFRYYIEGCAKPFGLDARPVWELYDIDPTWFPTGYDK